MVAGSVSLRSQRFFSPFPHGTCSLSVTSEYLALGGGPPRFTRSFTDIALLRIHLGPLGFRLQASHLLWGDFPTASPNPPDPVLVSYNPGKQAFRFGLFRFRSPLLTESHSLSFPLLTEMFHFSRCRPLSSRGTLLPRGYPIRRSPDHGLCAAPRGLSQLITSFIACWCQGIHHAPLLACSASRSEVTPS